MTQLAIKEAELQKHEADLNEKHEKFKAVQEGFLFLFPSLLPFCGQDNEDRVPLTHILRSLVYSLS